MSPPRSRRTTTKWNLFFQYASLALAMGSGILLVPVYLNYMSAELYGAWLATGNILAWLTAVDPGLSSVLQQKTGEAYGAQDPERISRLVGSGLLIAVAIATIVFVASLFLAPHLPSLLDLSSSLDGDLLVQAFQIAATAAAILMVTFGLSSVNLGLQGTFAAGLMQVFSQASRIIFILVLLFLDFGLLALPLGSLARAGLLASLHGVYLLWRFQRESIRLSPTLSALPELLGLSLYTALGRLSDVLSRNIDSFIVARVVGAEMVTIYNLTRKGPRMSTSFLGRISVAFMPAISHVSGEGDLATARRVTLRLLRIVFWLLGVTIAGFAVFNEAFVTLWVGESFYIGDSINLLICASVATMILVDTFSRMCMALGNIKPNGIAILIQNLVSIGLLIVGGLYLGLIGIVAAPLVARCLVGLTYFPRALAKLVELTAHAKVALGLSAIKTLVASLIVSLGFTLITPDSWITLALAAVSFGLTYLIAMAVFSEPMRDELTRAVNLAKKRIASRSSHR